MKAIGAKLFAFPPRRCDLLAIENVLILVKRAVRLKALCRNGIKTNLMNRDYKQIALFFLIFLVVGLMIVFLSHKHLCLHEIYCQNKATCFGL